MKTRVLFVALAIVSAGASYAQNKVNGTVIDRLLYASLNNHNQ